MIIEISFGTKIQIAIESIERHFFNFQDLLIFIFFFGQYQFFAKNSFNLFLAFDVKSVILLNISKEIRCIIVRGIEKSGDFSCRKRHRKRRFAFLFCRYQCKLQFQRRSICIQRRWKLQPQGIKHKGRIDLRNRKLKPSFQNDFYRLDNDPENKLFCNEKLLKEKF